MNSPSSQIFLDPVYRWTSFRYAQYHIRFFGHANIKVKLIDLLKTIDIQDLNPIKQNLIRITNNCAAIIEGPQWLFAFVDKNRSIPVFYVDTDGAFAVSNSARLLRETYQLKEIDALSMIEFQMAGYVTGHHTVFKDLYQLQAGECLIKYKGRKAITNQRYYTYSPYRVRQASTETLIAELDQVHNSIFNAIISRADGRPIWVPLSGGYDSRLIACKLKELGYHNLHCFSYGPPGNYEAKAAKLVAERLDLPWHFVTSIRRSSRLFFHTDKRKKYWQFCDGLCSVPNMQDLEPIISLRDKELLSCETIIINGQSGDFITGGHIPAHLLNDQVTVDTLCDAIVNKHFSLWINLKNAHNLSRIRTKILDILQIQNNGLFSQKDAVTHYEKWEWQERQCKYVINGQRVYDFLGFDWELPLWDSEYLAFWQNIPADLKFAQKLYRVYLEKYNFRDLFKNFKPVIWRWPGSSIMVIPIARILGVIFGSKIKKEFYNYMRYFGHYSNQYAPFGLLITLKTALQARNSVSLFVANWIKENLHELADLGVVHRASLKRDLFGS